MKIIFLDIDGVLNSGIYDRQRGENDGNIDISRLVLLKKLIDETSAKIVLTSSWRVHFDKDFEKCDEIGKEIVHTFQKVGLEIFDKTKKEGYLERADEVRDFLKNTPDVSDFVIFDDNGYGWGNLSDRFIKTDYRIGRGLEEKHIEKALDILNKRG